MNQPLPQTRSGFNFNLKTAVMPIVIINIIAFLLQMVLGNSFTDNFALVSSQVFAKPWMLLTHMFLHGGGDHIFWNMFGLIIFGPLIEEKIGAKRFLFIYLASGLIAGFSAIFFYSRALGASAAIMGMLGVLIILMPNLRLLFFFIIPMPLWLAGIVWAALDTFGIFFPSGSGNIAHLVGLGCGLLYGLYLKDKSKEIKKRVSSKSHIGEDEFEEYLRTGRI